MEESGSSQVSKPAGSFRSASAMFSEAQCCLAEPRVVERWAAVLDSPMRAALPEVLRLAGRRGRIVQR